MCASYCAIAVKGPPWQATWISLSTIPTAFLAGDDELLCRPCSPSILKSDTPFGIHMTHLSTINSQYLPVAGSVNSVPFCPFSLFI